MNVALVRKIDFWLGVPLCFLLSVVNWIINLIGFNNKETGEAKKIAFIKIEELGAIILAYPLLAKIQKEYPSAELFFVTFNKNKGIFKLLGGIIPDKNVLGIREGSFAFILDTVRAIGRLRKEKIDIVFDLEFFSRFSVILAYLTNARKKIGFYRYYFEGLYRGSLLTHRIQYNPLSHISKNYLSFIQVARQIEKVSSQMEEKIEESSIVFPEYGLNNELREAMLKKIIKAGISRPQNRLFLVNPGEGALPLREWPLENFILLSKLILEDNNNSVILIGTQGALGKAGAIIEAVNSSRCVSLVNQTELGELMELFNVSLVLISNDCGLAHLAMLTQIKKYIIFGPESPRVFGPLGKNSWAIYSNWPCSPCLSVLNHRNSSCKDNKCLKSISPEGVFDLIKKTQET